MIEEIELVKREGLTPEHRAKAWEKILARQRESGLTAQAFAAEHGLSADAFYRWREKFRKQSEPAESGFVELQASALPGEEPCALELHVQGLHIRVHNHCEARLLQVIVSKLQERSC